jgi:hypothetical protein
MALSDNRDPNLPRTHVNDLGDQTSVERASRGGWRWWWIWPVVIALVLWWAGWGWGGTGGWWFGRTNIKQNSAIPAPAGSRTTETIANAGAKQPLTNAGADAGGARPQDQMVGPGVQILQAQNKRAYIGKEFLASDVPVQQKASDRAVWIGGNNTMLAVVPRNSDKAADNTTPGRLVNAKGTVEKAPSAAKAKREWSLSDEDASRLEQEGAYIQVSQLTQPPQQP